MNESKIEVREIAFAFERGAGGLWNGQRPELSHMLNAFQLALPYLEPYFIDAIKEASARIDDPRIKADAAAFCAQEANHSRQHQRYNRTLRQRYPRLAEYEKGIQQSLVRSRQEDPLAWRLAYTAGYEAITAQLSRWMFRNERAFFEGADAHFGALMMWHAAEEIEHRHVAFDVLRAVDRRYALCVRGLFAALRQTQADIIPVVTYMLEVDGVGGRSRSRVRRMRLRLQLALQLLHAVARYLTPGYHPSKDAEPHGVLEWRRHYERHGALEWGPS
jgi:predicted metal-dependent hydrolase